MEVSMKITELMFSMSDFKSPNWCDQVFSNDQEYNKTISTINDK